MWAYHISTGRMTDPAGNARPELCYSGRGSCKNDPTKCGVVMDGPIPPGKYKIGLGRKSDTLGIVTMDLDPIQGTDTFGRSLFRIHGDSRTHPGDASHGCLVAPLTLRDAINFSSDKILEVQA
jgi:hypothetical protein